jgi:hypothetical protein
VDVTHRVAIPDSSLPFIIDGRIVIVVAFGIIAFF